MEQAHPQIAVISEEEAPVGGASDLEDVLGSDIESGASLGTEVIDQSEIMRKIFPSRSVPNSHSHNTHNNHNNHNNHNVKGKAKRGPERRPEGGRGEKRMEGRGDEEEDSSEIEWTSATATAPTPRSGNSLPAEGGPPALAPGQGPAFAGNGNGNGRLPSGAIPSGGGMSMGSGYNLPPAAGMMPNMPAFYPPMGLGMGMNIGMGPGVGAPMAPPEIGPVSKTKIPLPPEIGNNNRGLGAGYASGPGYGAGNPGQGQYGGPEAPQVKRKTVKALDNTLRLGAATINCWADGTDLVPRLTQIINLLRKGNYDVICCQEVLAAGFELFRQHLAPRYHIIETFMSEALPFGDCLLCRRDSCQIVEPYCYDYPKTGMSRKLLGCKILYKDWPAAIHVITTQLESGPANAGLRWLQCEAIERALANDGAKYVLLLADMAISSEDEPVERWGWLHGFRDAWIELGCPPEVKYTFDPRNNPRAKLLANNNGPETATTVAGKRNNGGRLRNIRCYLKWSGEYVVRQCRLLGSSLDNRLPPPSPYYGLGVEIVLAKKASGQRQKQ